MIGVSIRSASAFARAGLERALGADPRFRIIAESGFSDASERSLADVILIEGSEVDVGRLRFASDGPATRLVLLTDSISSAELARLFPEGVRSVLPRDSALAEIAAAVEAVAEDLAVLRPEFLEGLLPEISQAREEETGVEESLTARETEVLALLAEGAGNKEIAQKLGISENTAKFHVSSILGKLGATTRTEAVTRGYRRGLILI